MSLHQLSRPSNSGVPGETGTTAELSLSDSEFPLTPADAPSQHSVHRRLQTQNSQCSTSSCENSLQGYNGLVAVIRDDDDHIDLEEEERIWRSFDEDSRDAPKSFRKTPSPPMRSGPPSVFSNDIWIESTPEESNAFARGVRINGWTRVGDKEQGGAYVVYDISIIIASSPTPIHIHRRFSSLLALRSALLRSLPQALHPQIPELPPKAPWAKYRAAFLEKRRRALESWLAQILLHPEIGGSEIVRQWVVTDRFG